MLELAANLLTRNQNSDGGWGAVPGRRSNTEATSLALIALHSAGANNGVTDKARTWLVNRQRPDGGWPLNDSTTESSWATSLALLALSGQADDHRRVVKAGSWLLEQSGGKPGILAKLILYLKGQRRVVRLNQDLIGWPWTNGNFSWVEPTSYALLALKKVRRELSAENVGERINQAELMIYDRMCDGGGWNYGNSEVYGEKLWPYPDTTALALLATQDRRERDENRRSLALLKDLAVKANSGLALAWASICYRIYEQDTTSLTIALGQTFAKTQFLGETKTLALATLGVSDGGAHHFRF